MPSAEWQNIVRNYRPQFTFGLICFGTFAAFLEGVGIGFIYIFLKQHKAMTPTLSAVQ